jgi:hypothetical protein
MDDDNPSFIFCNLLCQAMEQLGRPPAVGTTMAQQLHDAGFEDVHVFNIKQPFGPWAKDKRLKNVGALGLLQAETAYHAYGERLHGKKSVGADRLRDGGIYACVGDEGGRSREDM